MSIVALYAGGQMMIVGTAAEFDKTESHAKYE
jgi:hypothetical protein